MLQISQRDVEGSARRFNEEFFIVSKNDGGPASVISKDLSKLRTIVDNLQKQFDEESIIVKKLMRGSGSETDQIVTLRQPVALELADGTRLEVAVRAAARP